MPEIRRALRRHGRSVDAGASRPIADESGGNLRADADARAAERRQVALLDRPRRHFHRCRCTHTRRPHPRPQAAVGEPRRLRRRGAGGHPAVPRRAFGGADPVGAHRRREDGDDRRHQRAAGAQGRPDAARHHPRASRTSSRSARRRGPTFSPSASSSRRCCTAASSRRTSACAPTARWSGRSISTRCEAELRSGARRRHRRGGHRLHARLRASRARAAGGGAGARARLCAGVGEPRGVAADQARAARRHDRCRRLPLARPAPLRRIACSGASGTIGVRPWAGV